MKRRIARASRSKRCQWFGCAFPHIKVDSVCKAKDCPTLLHSYHGGHCILHQTSSRTSGRVRRTRRDAADQQEEYNLQLEKKSGDAEADRKSNETQALRDTTTSQKSAQDAELAGQQRSCDSWQRDASHRLSHRWPTSP